jgi:hypothetical protein
LLAIDPVTDQIWVQLKSSPSDLNLRIRTLCQGPFKATLANQTPWTDNIRKNFNLQHAVSPGRGKQGEILTHCTRLSGYK